MLPSFGDHELAQKIVRNMKDGEINVTTSNSGNPRNDGNHPVNLGWIPRIWNFFHLNPKTHPKYYFHVVSAIPNLEPDLKIKSII